MSTKVLQSSCTVINTLSVLPATTKLLGTLTASARGDKEIGELTEAVEKPFSEIPVVRGWPVVGTAPMLIRRAFDGSVGRDSLYHDLLTRHGPIFKMKGYGGKWTVVAHSSDAAAAMYRAEGKCPSRGRLFEESFKWIHKKNKWPVPMAFARGEDWMRIRSAARKQESPKRVSTLTEPLCVIADNLLGHLRDSYRDGSVEDIRPAMTKWAFQGTAFFVLGEYLDVYSGNDIIQGDFMESSKEFTRLVPSVVSPLPVYRLHPTKSYLRFVQSANRTRYQGKKLIERTLKRDTDIGAKDRAGILQQWITEGTFTADEAITQACDLLAAGYDATANASIFMIFELAKQPLLQEQLYKEIKSLLEKRDNPTSDDLQKVSQIRHCVKETLRLYPPVAVGVREMRQDTVIHGYQVPAETTVLVTMGLLSHDRKYFSEPMKFKPERWRKDGQETIRAFSCLPFGHGPRTCYGRRLAELKLSTLLVKLILKYRLSTQKDSINVTRNNGLYPTETVSLTLTKR